jgi:2-polyprenyl-3-methyl-5-hydroxy-6-metoxy-1,4-benzoquinol methylase
MSEPEQRRVEGGAGWYLTEQLELDKRLIRLRHETLAPYCRGPEGLELGPAEGVMTRLLLEDFEHLTVVDGSAALLESIPDSPRLTKVHALFEEYEPAGRFDTVVVEHVLEHVDRPVELLRRARGWLAPGANLLVGVPNGLSFHRLAAVKMGLLGSPCELNERDAALGHRRLYTRESLQRDLEAAGLRVGTMGGVFFKPLSNRQIEEHWTEAMIRGFYELGKDFPENAAELYAVCTADA